MIKKMIIKTLFFYIFIFNFNLYTSAFETRADVIIDKCYNISTNYGFNKYDMRFVETADFYFFKLKNDSCESPGDVIITPIFDFKKFSCNSFESTTAEETPSSRKRGSFPSNPSPEEHFIHLRFDRSENDSLLTNLTFQFVQDSENVTSSFSTSSSSHPVKFKTHGVISHGDMDKYVYSYNSSDEIFCGLFVNGICADFCYHIPSSGGVPEDKSIEEMSFSQTSTEDSFTVDKIERLEDVYDYDVDNYNAPIDKHFDFGRKVKLLLYVFSGIFIVLVLISLSLFYNVSKKRGVYIL
uniref:Uncharacterized protein n=1 Tax=Armadillidium vulgare clopovirus TaxID=2984284 RepID=A0A9C7F100_9VIRU|nr:MAG: hypothetical protein [Armadillidium vulgare clopovirus]